MQRTVRSALILLLGVVPAPARALEVPFTGSLEITSPLVPTTVAGNGLATVLPASGGLRVPRSVFAFSVERMGTTSLVSRWQMEGHNGTGTIGTGSGSVTARLALQGVLRVRLNQPPGTLSEVTLPLSVIGGPRSIVGALFGTTDGALLSAALTGASTWRTGAITATGTTGSTLMIGGSNQLTPGGGGRLQLVTPVVLSVFEDGTPLGKPPGYARLTLDFVPESSTALFLLVTLGTLAIVAARRHRGSGGGARAAALAHHYRSESASLEIASKKGVSARRSAEPQARSRVSS